VLVCISRISGDVITTRISNLGDLAHRFDSHIDECRVCELTLVVNEISWENLALEMEGRGPEIR
jgi:hypothetical protein